MILHTHYALGYESSTLQAQQDPQGLFAKIEMVPTGKRQTLPFWHILLTGGGGLPFGTLPNALFLEEVSPLKDPLAI